MVELTNDLKKERGALKGKLHVKKVIKVSPTNVLIFLDAIDENRKLHAENIRVRAEREQSRIELQGLKERAAAKGIAVKVPPPPASIFAGILDQFFLGRRMLRGLGSKNFRKRLNFHKTIPQPHNYFPEPTDVKKEKKKGKGK